MGMSHSMCIGALMTGESSGVCAHASSVANA
jgi:hypothetical protein